MAITTQTSLVYTFIKCGQIRKWMPTNSSFFRCLNYLAQTRQIYFHNGINKQIMSALNLGNLPCEEKRLHVPCLEEIQQVLSSCLTANFQHVQVEVVDCPNLKQAPFNLANIGLGGSPTIIEVGGPSFLLPLVDATKIYDLKEILQKSFECNCSSNILGIGAGAGPFMLRKTNVEGIFNINIAADGTVKNESYTAKVDGPEENCVIEKIPDSETRFAVLLNLFACEAEPGKVLRVHCKKRIGSKNFIESIRTSLTGHFKKQCVGLGGIFLLKNGKVKQHVMRDFSKTPLNTEEELNNWLKFYEMPAVLNAVGTMVTNENDLDLRPHHFHSFSDKNWGGHYHYDITPDTVEYEGYFNVAERVIRIDKPQKAINFGRD